jgi:hypothetical protein
VAEGFAHKVSLFGGCQVESENKNTFSVNFENSTPAYFCFFRFYFPHKSQIGENPFFVRFVSKTTLEVVHSTTLFFFWQKKSQQNRTEQNNREIKRTDGRTERKKERKKERIESLLKRSAVMLRTKSVIFLSTNLSSVPSTLFLSLSLYVSLSLAFIYLYVFYGFHSFLFPSKRPWV